ncbi:MAG TPA: MFS transporter [Candidatus Sulfotelmatobacter sp.]|nr:MFS transporter [Candidatus Sulfotelmatobacter sp.]
MAALRRSRWLRILGVAFVMYVLSYIDRVNIAMATPAMRSELGLSGADIGFAIGFFFWGYIVLQIPAGRLAGVWSAKWTILIQLVLWSGAALSTAFVHTEGQLIANRFALGLSEGGVLTGTIVLIRAWFTRAERARANTMFLLSLAIAPVIANPISGLVLAYFDWRDMFLVEALPALLWGLVWCWAVADRPENARWLPAAERDRLVAALEAERTLAGTPRGHWIATLWHPAVLLLAVYNFGALMAEWGVNFWLPSVLKETGLSIVTVGFLSAIPYVVGALMMILVAWRSDRVQERKWHMITATAASGAFLILASLAPQGSTAAILICLTLAVGAFLGRFGPFWTLPSEILPPAVAGVGIGLINGAGNLGGTVGPYFFGYVRTATGSFSLALLVGGASLILGSLIAAPIRSRRVDAR